MADDQFHDGEAAAQARWNESDLWDAARRQRLLRDHIPAALQARVAGELLKTGISFVRNRLQRAA